MDVDKLIVAVFKRPTIWDKRIKQYANRNLVDKTWREISEEMVIEDAVLRKKWKNLRDYFGTEYSKRPINRSGDGADCPAWKSKWQYFSQLLFLKDIVAPRKSSGPLSKSIDDVVATDSQTSAPVFGPASPAESIDSDVTNPIDTTDSSVADASSASSTLTPTPPPKFTSRKRKVVPSYKNLYEKLLEIEQQKVTLLTERSHNKEPDDDDLLFLKSLHPFLKNIPMEWKMAFRSRVQLLIDEFSPFTTNEQLPSPVYRTNNSLPPEESCQQDQ